MDGNVLQLLASAAAGSLAGLLIKELLDLAKARAAHRRELQKQYFTLKLEKTLRAVGVFKAASAAIHDAARSIARTNRRIDVANVLKALETYRDALALHSTSLNSCSKALSRVSDEEFEIDAAMSFLYGPTWRAARTKISESLNRVFDTLIDSSAMLTKFTASALPNNPRELEPVIRQHIEDITALQKRMEEESAALEEVTDEVVDMLRRDFAVVRRYA